jgi:hypothetical protein
LLPLRKVNKKFVLLATGILLIVGMSAYYIAYLSFTGEDKSLSYQEAEVIKQESKIKVTANTDLVQRILYSKCNDEEVLHTKPTEKIVGLNVHQLQTVYQGWVFDKFDSNEVKMTLKVDSYCREHANNMFIGIQDGSVAVFYGRPGSRPILKETTNIDIDNLMVQDVEELQNGMIVQSKEELLQTLEGMQSR